MTLLTVQEAATRLRVSASSVYALVDSGRLACHRVGTRRGAIRISDEDLAEYLASCRSTPEVRSTRLARIPLKHLKL